MPVSPMSPLDVMLAAMEGLDPVILGLWDDEA